MSQQAWRESAPPAQLERFLYAFHQAEDGRLLGNADDAELSVQGTVEHGHGVLKGELGGGTMPCGRFGANAAWWRLNVLVHNLLQLVRVRSLPAEMCGLRPKALRFRLFNVAGLLVQHAHRLVVRVSGVHPWARALGEARESLLALYRQTRARPTPAG